MFDNLPIGPPVILPSSVPVDEIGRPEITQAQKQKIRDALNLVDPDAKAALLVFADLPSKTARANFAWRVGKGWTVAAGGGFEWEGEEAGGLDRRREGVEMSDEELPTCPHCDCRLRPERLGAGRYVCPGCARVFSAPPSKA